LTWYDYDGSINIRADESIKLSAYLRREGPPPGPAIAEVREEIGEEWKREQSMMFGCLWSAMVKPGMVRVINDRGLVILVADAEGSMRLWEGKDGWLFQ
jgi:hypothetical protein